MKSKNNPLSRKDNLVIQELDGEVLIYDLSDNKAYCLNETSMLVWQYCDGTKSVAEISKMIGEKLNSPATEDIVWFAIDQLKKEKLIENSDALQDNFTGMSRREVIKKVGMGTMIALPIVASIFAPAAVLAQSCTGSGATIGSPCTQDFNCQDCCCDTVTGVCAAMGTVANGMNANVACQCQGFPAATINQGMCVS